jgi:hypothetical protein
MAMSRVQASTPVDFPIDGCTVGFAGDEVIMQVRYTNYGHNCFFGDDDVAPVGF